MDIKEMISLLCGAIGVSGAEDSAVRCASDLLSGFSSVSTDTFGNVIAQVLKPENSEKHFLLDAHIDSIGLAVREIDENGFLKISTIGGMDSRTLPYREVTVHGEKTLTGIVCATPDSVVKENARAVSKASEIFVDLGMDADEVKKLVHIGDRITVDCDIAELHNRCVTGSFLDDRCGCAAVIRAAEIISQKKPHCGLTVLLSTREETGGQGATTAAYTVNPTHAVAVDVSFAQTPGDTSGENPKLGSGTMIGFSPCLSKELSDRLVTLAKEKEIPYTCEVMSSTTGTNADDILVTRAGVQTALLSIPQKYMHTPIETVCLDDVEATAALLAEFVISEAKR